MEETKYIKWGYYHEQVVIESEPGIFKDSYRLDEIYELSPGTWIRLENGNNSNKNIDAIIVDAYKAKGNYSFNDKWRFNCLLVDSLNENINKFYQIHLNDIAYPIEPSFQLFSMPTPSKTAIEKWLPYQSKVNDEFLKLIAKYPDLIDEIHPEEFEFIIQKIYTKFGFEVQKLGSWNQADGGVDLLATKKILPNIGEVRIAIQCKHSQNRISAEPIRALNGVLDKFKAEKGVVAISSSFTQSAVFENDNCFWRISLLDREKIIESLKQIFY